MLSGKNVVKMSAMISLLSAVLALPCQAGEKTEQSGRPKELVWSRSDGLRYEIYHSSYSYQEDAWEDPVKITDNNAQNFHPVLDTAPNGDKWAFWSAVRPDGISIEYAVNRDGTWSEPLKMELNHSSTITPSLLIDEKGTVLLVWAGNDGGRDEIYYSRYSGSSWSKAKTVNRANDVPDIKPELTRNARGQVEVQWQGFRDNTYRLLSSTYTGSGWSPEEDVTEEQEEKSEEELLKESGTALPEFIPEDSQYFLKISERIPNKNAATTE